MYQTTSQAILYGSCGAVRKFRCYVWSDCYTHSDSESVVLIDLLHVILLVFLDENVE